MSVCLARKNQQTAPESKYIHSARLKTFQESNMVLNM